MAIEDIEIETWADLERLIAKMTPEQKAQRVQAVRTHPDDEHVNRMDHGIAFAKVGDLEIRYCRSAVDNRHHDEEFVILLDRNMHAKDGAIAYDMDTEKPFSKEKPIYPKDHDESADWTGPAQKLLDATRERPSFPKVYQQAEIASRVSDTDRIP